MSAAVVPVTLLTGLAAADRAALVSHWSATRPRHERWAVLIEGALAPPPGQLPHDASVSVVQVGGCACCSGGLVLRVALTRLLRRQGWQHVLILAGAAARPSAIVAMLRSAPFEGLVEIREVVAALDATAAAAGLDASARLHEKALEQVDSSTMVLLAGGRALAPPAALALGAAVRDAAAGRRVLECGHGDWPDWAAIDSAS